MNELKESQKFLREHLKELQAAVKDKDTNWDSELKFGVDHQLESYLPIALLVKANHFQPSATYILDLGCSFGLQSVLFNMMGFNYIGVDIAEYTYPVMDILEELHQKESTLKSYLTITFYHCSIEEFFYSEYYRKRLNADNTVAVMQHLPLLYPDNLEYQPNIVRKVIELFPSHICM